MSRIIRSPARPVSGVPSYRIDNLPVYRGGSGGEGPVPPACTSCLGAFIGLPPEVGNTSPVTCFGPCGHEMVADWANQIPGTLNFAAAPQKVLDGTGGTITRANLEANTGYVFGCELKDRAVFENGEVSIWPNVATLSENWVLSISFTDNWGGDSVFEAFFTVNGTPVGDATADHGGPKVLGGPPSKVFILLDNTGQVFLIVDGVEYPFVSYTNPAISWTLAWDMAFPAASTTNTQFGGIGNYISGQSSGTCLADASQMSASDFPDMSAYGITSIKDFCGNEVSA